MTGTEGLGVLDGLDEATYHRHPALSASGAKKLLPPSCPALFRWQRDNPPESTKALDLGSAAHKLVLGVGAEIVAVDADDWRTKAAKDARDEAHAAGAIPLLREDVRVVEAMAAALREHPIASALFDPDRGKPEQSLFWTDPETGVPSRARLDWLPDAGDGRLIVGDYKTTVSAEPGAFAKSCASYGYAVQAAWYLEGVAALGLADHAAFVFVAQEKTPPYLVTVCQLDREALLLGERLAYKARTTFAHCTATDTWPAYVDDVAVISLPGWFVRMHDDLLGVTA